MQYRTEAANRDRDPVQTLQRFLRAAGVPRDRCSQMERDPLFSSYQEALVLLASVEIGQNIDRLARLTGVSRAFVAQCARRLVDNGVWENGGVVCTWTADSVPADPAFWYDVAVAEGKLLRRRTEAGEIEWGAPGDWVKDFTYVQNEPAGLQTVYHERVAPEEPSDPAPRVALQEEASVPRDLKKTLAKPETAAEPATARPPVRERPLPTLSHDPIQQLFSDAHWLK